MSEPTKKVTKRTNSNQFQKLVELMEQNPDVPKGLRKFGSTNKSNKELWDIFGVELNTLGPPIREGKEWHKVWLDYKQKLKNKIANNKKEIVSTGGGPYSQLSLSPIEQAVDTLLSLQIAVNPDGEVFGPSGSGSRSYPNDDDYEEEERLDLEQDDLPINTPNTPKRSSRISKLNEREKERLSLLQNQASNQMQLLQDTKNIEKDIHDIARYARNSYDLKNEELALLKGKEKRKEQENIDQHRRHQENLEMRLRYLDLKKLKYLGNEEED